MIFLYALDYVPDEGSLERGYAPASGAVDSSAGRRVYLFTNYERRIEYAAGAFNGSLWPKFTSVFPEERQRDPLGAALPPSDAGKFVFHPQAVEHTGLRLDGEQSPGATTLTLPLGHPLAQLYARDFPAGRVYLTIWSLDTPTSTPRVIWVGLVDSCSVEQPVSKLECQHIRRIFERVGLTAGHPRTCPKALYSAACGVKRNAEQFYPHPTLGSYRYFKHREDGFLASVSADGMELTVLAAANRPDGFFVNGFVTIGAEYPDVAEVAGGTQAGRHIPRQRITDGLETFPSGLPPRDGVLGGFRRSIVGHTGTVIKLDSPVLAPLPAGSLVSLFQGCNKALDTCENSFGNVPNYGGYAFIPIKNPFESGIKG